MMSTPMRVDDYSFGRIVISGKEYRHDVLLYRDEVKEWWRERGHHLQLKDLEWLLDRKEPPEALVIGSGRYGAMTVPEEVVQELERRGIAVQVKPTKEACEEFNRLAAKKRVAGAFHLTC